jgi:tRNA modification GTPase
MTLGPRIAAVHLEDTIVAVATPSGRGALALIRLTGPAAFAIARKHVTQWPTKPRVARLSNIHRDGEVLDQALVTFFAAPDSFTGDDTIEISSHGGLMVPGSIVAALTMSGARQADPGEFTRRALLNGKVDIVQAEAIGDLIDARSHAMQHAALYQLDGGLSRRLVALREDLIALEALVAYDIDFPDEDDGPVARERITAEIGKTIDLLESLLSTVPAGELIREGAVIVIAGPPNAGKSSLFNSLIGKSRAIVTEIPGTTRDALEAVIESSRYSLRLVDTAGLRETTDQIERLGIEVSERYLSAAHVVLACAETPEAVARTANAVAQMSKAPVIGVRTKADLVAQSNESRVTVTGVSGLERVISVSAEAGTGLQTLLTAIDATIADKYGQVEPDLPMLTNARHIHALTGALAEVQAFGQSWHDERLPAPVASVHLRAAVHILEELIGAVDVEDIFERVFKTFCVGK